MEFCSAMVLELSRSLWVTASRVSWLGLLQVFLKVFLEAMEQGTSEQQDIRERTLLDGDCSCWRSILVLRVIIVTRVVKLSFFLELLVKDAAVMLAFLNTAEGLASRL